jgi:hypothetical protein
MKQTLSYVIVTPYSIVKSRTGGVISRLLSRSNLELAGAQIIAPDENFVQEYADALLRQASTNLRGGVDMLANYVKRNLGPDQFQNRAGKQTGYHPAGSAFYDRVRCNDYV